MVKLIEDLHSVSFLLNVQTNSWCIFTLVNKFGAGVVEVKKSTGIEKTTSAGKTCNSKKYLLSTEGRNWRDICGLSTQAFISCSDQIKTTEQVYIKLKRRLRQNIRNGQIRLENKCSKSLNS